MRHAGNTLVAAKLSKALAMLDADGWCQGAARNGEKRCSLSLLIVSGDGDSDASCEAFLAAIDEKHEGLISIWNDAPGRTIDDVRDAFKRAILIAGAAQ